MNYYYNNYRYIDNLHKMNVNQNNYIYLCLKCKDDYNIFQCKRFDSYNDADKEFKINFNSSKYYDNYISTMIPIPRFIPTYFHTPILNNVLSRSYVKAEIVNEIVK